MPPSSNDLWIAPAEVVEAVAKLIAAHHPMLAHCDKEIAVIFKAKAGTTGGQKVLGRTTRAAPLLSVLTKQDYKYVLEIAADEWQLLNELQRTALLDHLLCYCKVEEDEQSGEIKFGLRAPQVSMFWDEVKRHGVWRSMPEGMESDPAPLKIEEAVGG